MDGTSGELMEYISLYFTTGVRWVFMGLAVLVLLHQIFALLKMRNPSEIWAYLKCPDDTTVPLTHWENLVGRHRGCDVVLNIGAVSRSHGTLIRDSAGVWEYNDLNSKNGSFINGKKVTEPTVMKGGDVLSIGGTNFELYPLSLKERMENIEKRKRNTKKTSPWLSLLAITVFQFLTVIQFRVSLGDDFPAQLPMAFFLLCALMWAYVILLRTMKKTGFEVEIIAFFLSTLSLAVTASAYPGTVFKQAICVVLGVILFLIMCWILRDLSRAKKLVYIMIGASVLLLFINLIAGTVVNGSQNWVSIGGFSFQPSELIKIVFIFVGAATLDELQQRRNLLVYMGFSFFCLICLAIMGDFGTAMIFFATFLVVSFLRSGDFTKLFLVLGAAGLMGLMVLRFKPYVATRFEIWRHVWDDPTGAGYQQVQTMTSIASGGIPGLGAGEGNLSDVAASSTDLVFGLLAEEWGLVIAVLSVLCIVTLGVFAYRCIIAGRSTYYCIAACAATSLFIFQTILNVFGSIDLLPLTGVTFPFVSSGGTSMISSWGMLAFLKAADTRQGASLAVRVKEKRSYEEAVIPESPEELKFEDLEEVEKSKPTSFVEDRPEPMAVRRVRATKGIMPAEFHHNPTGIGEEQELKEEPKSNEISRNDDMRGHAGPVHDAAHPKAIKYKDVSDDDFFGQFDKASGSGESRTARRTEMESSSQRRSSYQFERNSRTAQDARTDSRSNREEKSSLTLEDLFGDDDDFFGRNRKSLESKRNLSADGKSFESFDEDKPETFGFGRSGRGGDSR